MSETTQEIIERVGLIPVLRARSSGQAHAIVQAMLAGGVTVVEVTMTVPGAVDLIKELKQVYFGELLLGSGTVTTADEAQATIDAGAEFVVSPSLHPDVISVTKKNGKLSIPGALTPTEVITAWRAGSDFVKIFPCGTVGGAKYIKALKAPLPQVPMVPTGGVTLETAADFLRAGADALGIGGELISAAALKSGNVNAITDAAQQYVAIVRRARQDMASPVPS